MRRQMHGFTLIELMLVIVVVAILASIAVPSYRSYMIRTNRTEATAALLQIRSAQEKFFLQKNRYADTDELTDAPPDGLGLPAVTPNNRYDIFIDGDNTTFTATATPHAGGGQEDDGACQSLSIDESGLSDSSPASTAVCWK